MAGCITRLVPRPPATQKSKAKQTCVPATETFGMTCEGLNRVHANISKSIVFLVSTRKDVRSVGRREFRHRLCSGIGRKSSFFFYGLFCSVAHDETGRFLPYALTPPPWRFAHLRYRYPIPYRCVACPCPTLCCLGDGRLTNMGFVRSISCLFLCLNEIRRHTPPPPVSPPVWRQYRETCVPYSGPGHLE